MQFAGWEGNNTDRDSYVDKLSRVFLAEEHRGFHQCEFCRNASGNGMLLVPGERFLFIAPVMVTHYITDHNYKPPEVFLEALTHCPETEATCSSTRCRISGKYYTELDRLLGNVEPGREYLEYLKQIRDICSLRSHLRDWGGPNWLICCGIVQASMPH